MEEGQCAFFEHITCSVYFIIYINFTKPAHRADLVVGGGGGVKLGWAIYITCTRLHISGGGPYALVHI
jgi:heme O synthase-like polyprenyltransferase